MDLTYLVYMRARKYREDNRKIAVHSDQVIDYFFIFGNPIHFGVLFVYSRYAPPYFSRHQRSSTSTM